jgi:FtsH-binding integral membrane protein
MPNTQKEIDILMKEYERLAADIRGIETMIEKVVGFGITLVGAGFAYGVQQNIIEMFFFLPIALIGVLLYAILQYHNMFWFGGYKRAVEERINELSGKVVLNWETLIAKQRGRIHTINATMATVYVTAVVGVTWYSLVKIFSTQDFWLALIYAWIVLSFLVLAGFSIREMTSAYGRAYKDSRVAIGRPLSS